MNMTALRVARRGGVGPWAVLCAWFGVASSLSLPRPLRRAKSLLSKERTCGLKNCEDAPIYDGSSPLKVVVWNIQYGAGIRQHFFYDGGRAVGTPREEVEVHTKGIADALAETGADVLLLQEVDRRSARTHKIDEFRVLAEALEPAGLVNHCSAAYWRVPYVPHPKHDHVGRIGMHLATFSHYQLGDATRYQLPLLRESRLRRLFNLKRAVLATPLKGDSAVTLLNTHLSAFSFGDGTVERQVAMLTDVVLPKQTVNWLLAGDFNSLTPYESSETLAADEAALYPEDETPVAPLYASTTPLWASADARQDTYKPWTSPAPDRTIDHAFASPGAAFSDPAVLKTDGYLSDHQPVMLSIEFPASSKAGA